MKKSFIVLLILCSILITPAALTNAIADNDDGKKRTQTLESECAKKKPTNFDGLLCQSILGLQLAFGDIGTNIQQVIDLLTNPNFGLQEIKNEVSIIEQEVLDPQHGLASLRTSIDDIGSSGGGIPQSTQTQIDILEIRTGLIKTETSEIQSIKNDIESLKNSQYVPFKTTLEPSFPGFVCASAGDDDGDFFVIDNAATSGTFVVNSIIFEPLGINNAADAIRVDGVFIDGVGYTLPIPALTGTASRLAFEILGANQFLPTHFPMQITAESDGPEDIKLNISCSPGISGDITFFRIQVSGWKLSNDIVELHYLE